MGTFKVYFQLENCSTNLEIEEKENDGGYIKYQTVNTYNTGDKIYIEVTAAKGYYFPTTPFITAPDLGAWGEDFLTDETGDFKTTYHYEYEYTGSADLESYDYPQVTAEAIEIPKIDNKYGIITIYNPTPEELALIGDERYIYNQETVDLGDYISSLIKVFVNLPKGEKEVVSLGGFETGVSCNVLVDDIIETDCGTVSITGIYDNAMDYENTTVEIYLPFIGFKTLDTDKVMNETLSLFYKTNIINGDSIACISNTTGTLLYTFNCKASFEIPYRLNNDMEPKGQLEINSNYLFGFTPFITVRYNKAYNTANVIANDNREAFIKDITGYIKCGEVFNTVKATATEKAEIERLLKEGIII